MVSTRNTSKSHANPPRMQDQLGDVDSRPPGGTLETVQVNKDEVEVFRITNQHLLREFEQLTRQIQRPQETRQARKGQNLVTREDNTSTLIEKQIEKEKLLTPGSMVLTNPPERIATRRGMAGTTKAMGPSFISRRQRSGRGSKGSRISSENSAT